MISLHSKLTEGKDFLFYFFMDISQCILSPVEVEAWGDKEALENCGAESQAIDTSSSHPDTRDAWISGL